MALDGLTAEFLAGRGRLQVVRLGRVLYQGERGDEGDSSRRDVFRCSSAVRPGYLT